MNARKDDQRLPGDTDEAMEEADVANGEGPPGGSGSDEPVNDAEERYGEDESPA